MREHPAAAHAARSRARKLRKRDKRAAVLPIAFHGFTAKNFGPSDDGRYYVDWRCSYEYDEWDSCPAWEKWTEIRAWDHPHACAWWGFDEKTGQDIPLEQQPRSMRLHEAREFYALRAPAGHRWRGRRLVPVDKSGGMLALPKPARGIFNVSR